MESFDECCRRLAEKERGEGRERPSLSVEDGKAEKAPAAAEPKAAEKKSAGEKPSAPKQDAKAVQQHKAKEKADTKKADDVVVQARTKGDKRTVDTRIAHVQLDKYNEKYDNIAQTTTSIRDTETNKQKIKQKSQQYRKRSEQDSRGRKPRQRPRESPRKTKKPITITVPMSLRSASWH